MTCPAIATVANGTELICLSPVEGEKKIGSISMQTAAKSNLTRMSFSSFNRKAGWMPTIEKPELNQQISQAIIRRIHRRQSLTVLAEELVAVADQAFPFRQMDAVEQASDILLNLPLPREFKSIASYYKGFCLY
jgi:hypothetical protein